MANYDDSVMLGLSIAFAIIATASVIFRFQARRIKRLNLEADDWTLLAALVFDIAVTVALLIDSTLGNVEGLTVSMVESNPVDKKRYTIFSKTLYAVELLVWPCVGLTKISVLLLYRRIFIPPATGAFKILVWCLIWLAVLWTVIMEFTSIFSCVPISSRWDPAKPSSCIDDISFYTAALSIDVITDGLILLLPIYKVQKLQMPLQHKLAVIGMFGLGALVTITGIIRLHYVVEASVPLALSGDFSHNYDAAYLWSIIETNAGILSACLPTLRPLYNGYRINSLVSKLPSFFCRGSRSTTRIKDDIHLNSIGPGFSDNVSKVAHRRAGDPFAIYDDLDSPIRRPELLPDYEGDRPWRSSQEYNPRRTSTHANQIT